jgi:thiosulfate/3-mercaptopyruvate sulfurtransferase
MPQRCQLDPTVAKPQASTMSRSVRTFVRALLALAVVTRAGVAQGSALPVIVTGEWLAPRVSDTTLVVVHAANAKAEYDAGHVPGARFLPFGAYAIQDAGLSTQLASIAQLDSSLESIGVGDGKRVVVYGQPIPVSRLFMTLEHLGLKGRVAVLDGGIDAWREGGGPISHDAPTVAKASFTPQVASNVIVDLAWVRDNAAAPGVSLLDARTPEFYLGYSPGQMPRAGHIPGANNVPFTTLTSELTRLRDASKLRPLFERAGVRQGNRVVTYCHIGMQASVLYLAARSLGYDASLFDGSFEEWSKRSELPVVVEAAGKK